MKTPLTLCLFLISWLHLCAQDPFYTHFFNNRSGFNPALTGLSGALTVNAKYKSQWRDKPTPSYASGAVNLEESLPCSVLDYGFHFNFDEEGDGRFRTYDFGLKFAGTAPFEAGRSLHNVRFGGTLQWSYKTVDYRKLTFSDQFDPKLGAIYPTSFIPPNDGRSFVFFSPAVGFAHQVLFNQDDKQSPSLIWGASLHNAYSLGPRHLGNEESILGIGTRIPQRIVGFLEMEFIPYNSARHYFSVRPLLMMQRQAGLHYFEAGSRLSLSRLASFGLFYHFNQPPYAGRNTNWFSFSLEFGDIIAEGKRIDLGFAYSNNFSGLRNAIGPVFEVSLALHFATSPGCRLMGREDEVGYGNIVRCPNIAASGRRKMYENIWYKR